MSDAGGRGCNDVERPHHPGRKLVEDGQFQARDGGETRMVARACGKIDPRAPDFVERVGRRADHAGKSFDAFKFAHRRSGQDGLDGRTQALFVDRANEAASQSDGGLLERHDLKAVTTVTASRQPALPHGETTVNDKGGSICACHVRQPLRNHLRFER